MNSTNNLINNLISTTEDKNLNELFNIILDKPINTYNFLIRQVENKVIYITGLDTNLLLNLSFKLQSIFKEYSEYEFLPIKVFETTSCIKISGFDNLSEFYSILKLIK